MFLQMITQTCIVHLIRNSLDVVGWKDRKTLMPLLKAIFSAPRAAALDTFEASPCSARSPGHIGMSKTACTGFSM